MIRRHGVKMFVTLVYLSRVMVVIFCLDLVWTHREKERPDMSNTEESKVWCLEGVSAPCFLQQGSYMATTQLVSSQKLHL